MSLLTSARRAIPAVTLFALYAYAQQCYFPDGTVSSDQPCLSGQTSGCCASQSYCLSGGFCLTGGVVTRGSCSSKDWNSPDCASFCRTESTSGELAITPCSTGISTNTFVCGLDSSQCNNDSSTFALPSDLGIILNPAQQATLLKQALGDSGNQSANSGSGGSLTSGQATGLGVGIALPLLLALAVAIYLLIKERRFGKRRSMIKLPDENDKEYRGSRSVPQPSPKVVTSLARSTSHASGRSAASSASRTASTHVAISQQRPANLISPAISNVNLTSPAQSPALSPTPSFANPARSPSTLARIESPQRPLLSHNFGESPRIPSQVASFAERIEASKPELVTISHSSTKSTHELDSSPLATPRAGERFELSTNRMSA